MKMLQVMMPIVSVILALTTATTLSFPHQATQPFQRHLQTGQEQCHLLPQKYQQAAGKIAKTTYNIGVLVIRGINNTYNEYNTTFGEYLTQVVGSRFDPPLTFRMEPVLIAQALERFTASPVQGNDGIDFFFANPAVFSCVQSEVGASALVTQIAQRNVNGSVHELTQFGGVIFTKAGNDAINTVADLRGKRIAAVSLTGLGAAQMQFAEMRRNGLHHLQDPRQLVFTSDQRKIVNAVLQDQVDVGFVRTDQLERSTDPRTGLPLDLNQVKIIGNQRQDSDDNTFGPEFPFPHSTSLYPEWALASRTSVPTDVARQVQDALLSMGDHGKVGLAYQECLQDQVLHNNATTSNTDQECWNSLDRDLFLSCDTTPNLALAAVNALNNAKMAGWVPPSSYMSLRNLQEDIDFIGKVVQSSPTAGTDVAVMNAPTTACVRHDSLDEAVVCPPGHFKKLPRDILTGCDTAGLDCYGFPCLCSPCVKAYDVSFFPVTATDGLESQQECSKFQVCGEVEQASSLRLRVIDNMARPNATFKANIIVGFHNQTYDMQPVGSDKFFGYEFVFDATNQEVGFVIVEVFANDEQVDQSPFRLLVTERTCGLYHSHRVADTLGNCVCAGNTASIGKHCIPFAIFLPCIIGFVAVISSIGVYYYVEKKRLEADAVWLVKPEDVHFEDPPRVLGRGTFGVVLLAEYRGTQVAVKRVLPPRDMFNGKTSKSNSRNSQHGSSQLMSSSREGEPADVEMARDSSENSSEQVKGKLFNYLSKGSRSTTRTQENANNGTPDLNDDEVEPEKTFRTVFDVDFGTRSLILSRRKLTEADASIPADFGAKTGFFDGKSFSIGLAKLGDCKKGAWLGWSKSAHSRLQSDFIEEMRHLSKLRHPCIVTTMGAIIQKKHEPMMILEYMELGSLYDLLHNSSTVLEGDLVIQMLQNIVQGIRFLHVSIPVIVHGDLKSANVLVDSNFRAKVSDFGLHQKSKSRRTGTPLWMAPELLLGEASNSIESDMYSFGILLYEVFSRKDPYEGEDHMTVLRHIADRRINKRPPVPMGCPPVAGRLMEQCLLRNPVERPDATQAEKILRSMSASHDNGPSNSGFYIARSQGNQTSKDELLFQMFPRHIAEALCDGRKVEPQRFDCATVFFSDIVGYTSIASNLSPEKVSDMLDRLYTALDRLCGIHQVFKVETVGDAFMAVTNVADVQTDKHARLMAEFAVDAVLAASQTLIDQERPEMGKLKMRAGFHSGPVVASVCGTRNQRFSIIGDTVNTASRMESHSLPGMIQCSAETARLLQLQAPHVGVKQRGVVNIKGKGRMKTFWVQSSSDNKVLAVDPILERKNLSFPELAPIEEQDQTEVSEASSSKLTVNLDGQNRRPSSCGRPDHFI